MFGAYVIKQYERAVVFKLGKVEGEAREPGLMLCVPLINRIQVAEAQPRPPAPKPEATNGDRVAAS